MLLEFFFPIALAVVALIVAIRSFNQASELRMRIEALEAAARSMPARPVPAPPPLPPQEPARPAAAPVESVSATTETAPPIAPEPVPQAVPAMSLPPADSSQPPSAQPGFEERIGTRWVVWVGGLTLALGGFF